MSRDTLLLITTSYPQRGDGSEAAGAFVADLAESLAELVPVRVVAPGAKAGATERCGAVYIRRFASPGRPLSLLSPGRPSDWPAIVGTLRSLRTETLLAAADKRIVHTLAMWALPSGWGAAVLQRSQGVPYSVWALGSDIWSLGRIPVVRSVLRSVIRGAVNRYADGLELGREAARIGGGQFRFLPSTRRLHGQRAQPPASSPPYRLLFLGRWHLNKGVDLLLDALMILDDHSWAHITEVHIAGGGPMESLVREKVVVLQAAGRPLRLSGFLNRQQATAALMEADYFLLPSRIESIPVVFSDAIKMQLPVISMPVGDLPALIGQYDVGVLASQVDAYAFANALREALKRSPKNFLAGMSECASYFSIDLRRLCHELKLEKNMLKEVV